ncbi:hypothetical protein K437DRAFT_270753 [Tilletiaria anomala UBC 951]|uniref:mRNA export factor GLE1 n=1 Tax=Tilletiaria anomala (strain ATCC 24038 / CBS 436.72 / UBC 951) TaxID=1037660 RepID=A0A066V8L9_TILAU|nr:uncharacterized protein K437DRAFT_270753 [Tilletiaria anomala UBC 951]KDN37806.1 hypothetical protein K437DRAFT_270753 [Tilletiaria anomala UBC 951]
MYSSLHHGGSPSDSEASSFASDPPSDSLGVLGGDGHAVGDALALFPPSTSLSSRYHSILLRAKLSARQRSPSPWNTGPKDKTPPLPWLQQEHNHNAKSPHSHDTSPASSSSSSMIQLEDREEDELGMSSPGPSTTNWLEEPDVSSRSVLKTRRARSHAEADRALRWAASVKTDDWDTWEASWRQGAFRREARGRKQSRLAAEPQALTTPSRQSDDLESIRKILGTLRVSQQQEEEALKNDFNKRSEQLWFDIEQTIRKAEDDTRKAAEAEAERLRSMRLKQIEQERIAEETRRKEQQRVEEERRAEERTREEKRQKEQEQLEQKHKEEQQARVEKEAQERKSVAFSNAKKDYEHWKASMEDIKKNVLPAVSSNPTWKKQCFDAKRRITPKISQLTNSREEVVRIAILEVLNAAKGTGAKDIYIWILNHLSKCLIRQAEQEVAVNQSAAFPLAQVVSWLLLEDHVELGTVLMSRLVKKCCWCLPYLPLPSPGQDDQSYLKQIGRKDREESQNNYVSRMCGIFAFYMAVLQTKPTSPPSSFAIGAAPAVERIPEHFRSFALWRWQAQSLQPPLVHQSLTPNLWSTFFDIAGATAQRLYGRQAAKVWLLLFTEGIRAKRAKWSTCEDATAATARLTLLLEQWQREGSFKEAKGSQMGP